MIKDWEVTLYWFENLLMQTGGALTVGTIAFWTFWKLTGMESNGARAIVLIAIPTIATVWAIYAALSWLQPHWIYFAVWTKVAEGSIGDFPVGKGAEITVLLAARKALQKKALEAALASDQEFPEKFLKFGKAWNLLTMPKRGGDPLLRGEEYRQTARQYLARIAEEKPDDTCRGLTYG